MLIAPVPTISWRRVGFIPVQSTDGSGIKMRLQERESENSRYSNTGARTSAEPRKLILPSERLYDIDTRNLVQNVGDILNVGLTVSVDPSMAKKDVFGVPTVT